MDKVLDVVINPDIVLDERFTKNMPESIRQHLLITITIAMDRYECDWRDLTWKVRFNIEKQPYISVKKK